MGGARVADGCDDAGEDMPIAGIPVRVRSSFFFVAALMASRRADATSVAIWMAASFASVLVHELGHAFMARALGRTPSIELNERGGLTSFAGPTTLSAWQAIVISAAGPAAGFVLGGFVYGLSHTLPPDVGEWRRRLLLDDLLWCNLGWGVLNLLPIMPLDGGHVARRALLALRPRSAERDVHVLSLAVAAMAAVVALEKNWPMGAFYVAWLVAPSFGAVRRAVRDSEAAAESAEIMATLVAGDGAAAFLRAESMFAKFDDDRLKAKAVILMGYALIVQARFSGIEGVLARTPRSYLRDEWLEGLALLERGQEKAALDKLRSGYSAWIADRTLRVLFAAGRTPTALKVADLLADQLDLPVLAAHLFYAGKLEASADLSMYLFERRRSGDAAYNVACAYGRLGRVSEGVAWLVRAVEAGYADLEHLSTDADIDGLRGDPGFDEVVARITPRAEARAPT